MGNEKNFLLANRLYNEIVDRKYDRIVKRIEAKHKRSNTYKIFILGKIDAGVAKKLIKDGFDVIYRVAWIHYTEIYFGISARGSISVHYDEKLAKELKQQLERHIDFYAY